MNTPAANPTDTTALRRELSLRSLAATAFNVTVGGGIFALPALVATTVGRAAPIAYAVCALAMSLVVVCFAIAGKRVTTTGGPYAYVETALGPFAGFLAGVLLFVLMVFATSAVSSAFVSALAVFVPSVATPALRIVTLGVTFAILALLHMRGIRTGARVVEVVTVAKLLPLLLFVIVGAVLAQNVHPTPLAPAPPGALGRSVVVLIFAFAGIESALVPSGEVRDPARTVPRALAIAMTLVTLLYITIQLVADRILGSSLTSMSNAGAPLAAAARVVAGSTGATIVGAGAVISMLGYLVGMTLATPRALYALARDGFLPRALARVNSGSHAPDVAIVTTCIVVFALAASSGFAKLAILSNVAVLSLYLLCCSAAWALVRRDGLHIRTIVPWIGAAMIVWILAHATAPELGTVAAVLVAAAIVYAIVRGVRPARTPA